MVLADSGQRIAAGYFFPVIPLVRVALQRLYVGCSRGNRRTQDHATTPIPPEPAYQCRSTRNGDPGLPCAVSIASAINCPPFTSHATRFVCHQQRTVDDSHAEVFPLLLKVPGAGYHPV